MSPEEMAHIKDYAPHIQDAIKKLNIGYHRLLFNQFQHLLLWRGQSVMPCECDHQCKFMNNVKLLATIVVPDHCARVGLLVVQMGSMS